MISNLFQEIIYTATMPFVALYLTDMISVKFSGIFLTIAMIISMIFSFIGGHINDSNRKKNIIVYLQILMSIFLLLMGISLLHSSLLLFCSSYLFFTIAFGIQYPIMEAAIMDAITEHESYVYKLSYWITNVGVAIGSVVGAVFYGYKPHLLFTIGFIVYILVALAFIKWFTEIIVQRRTKKHNNILRDGISSYTDVLKDRRYMVLTIGFSLIIIGELSIYSYIAINLKQNFKDIYILFINIDGIRMYSIILLLNTIIVVFFTFKITKYIEKISTEKVLILGLSLYTVGYVGLSYFNTLIPIIIVIILATVGEIIYSPIYSTERYKIIPESKRGSYSALETFGFYCAEIVARLAIVLGVYLSSFNMSLLLLIILTVGSIMVYRSLTAKKSIN
ncbi:MFS transporter [Pseudogracilibacillus sp. SE30717A]|uniref:MFS transporter n=1 Tax=Pseudogracilibacillus sp. SE30717A TaxID=3098293 RepID=UPI00300E1B4C